MDIVSHFFYMSLTDIEHTTLAKKQGRIHGISRSPSSFLPADKVVTEKPTDGPTNQRTD